MKPQIKSVFDSYPSTQKEVLYRLRALIIDVAQEKVIKDLEETLKWGQAAYLSKSGSTIRLGWSEKTPENCFIYFNCQSKLVETFRVIFPKTFTFNGNRAICLNVKEPLPDNEIKICIAMALNYHQIKNLPLLGA